MTRDAWNILAALVVLAALLGPPLVPRTAEASPTAKVETNERAVELFQRSMTSYREGRFQEAIDLLLEVYRLKPEPVLRYNLGRAYEALGDMSAAAEAYTQYLAEDPEAQDRKAIEGRIATLRRQIAEREAPAPSPSPPPRSPAEPPKPVPPEPPPSHSAVPLVVAGVGVAAAGTGVVLWVVARGRHEAAVSDTVQSASVEAQGEARRWATAGNVLVIAGGVVAAVGVGWAILDRARAAPEQRSARLVVGPAGIALVGGFD
jgi:tetratricopeptide (TPR) repeat protein